jgi:hypothetical protein
MKCTDENAAELKAIALAYFCAMLNRANQRSVATANNPSTRIVVKCTVALVNAHGNS